MRLQRSFAIVVLCLFVSQVAISFDPLSASVALGAAAISKAGKLFCATGLRECCSKRWIKNDVYNLLADLKKKLHGQHLVIPNVVQAIGAHILDENPQKPLVMSFHGWTGGGKSFVSQMIIENLYQLGEKSNFVHLFYSEIHFKHNTQVDTYKDQLHQWIYSNVSSCERSLFLFDEMDHMPPGMIDVLIPFLGHNRQVDGVDFRKSIFIFISNTGGDVITNIAYKQFKAGKPREDLTLRDFQDSLEMSNLNMMGGLKGSDIIRRQLIDHLIPFLPLERRHVKMCIEDEIHRLGRLNISDALTDKVLKELGLGPENDAVYSTSGCTKVSQKTKLF